MTTSAILLSLPSDSADAKRVVDSLMTLPHVMEVLLPLPLDLHGADGENDQLDIDGLRVIYDERIKNSSQALNVGSEFAIGDTILFLEVPVIVDAGYGPEMQDAGRDIIVVPIFDSAKYRDWDDLSSFPDLSMTGGRPVAYAINKNHFLMLRGFDERTNFSQAMGLDLVERQRRLGGNVRTSRDLIGWCDMPSSAALLKNHVENADAEYLRVSDDKSIFRNLSDWSVEPTLRPPLVTVAVATKDRGHLLLECLQSIQLQTFQDFEVIIVDDGSRDPKIVRQVVEELSDPRFRSVRLESSYGVSHARNIAALESQCYLTAVHDDDDLMLPERLELGIRTIGAGCDASYGGWINFDDVTGDLRGFVTKENFSHEMLANSGAAPGHSTWTLPTRLIRDFRYDERLTASVDHELATRLLNAGVRWKHVGDYMYLRRVHTNQITGQDSSNQKAGHTLSLIRARFLANANGHARLAEAGGKLKWPTGMSSDNLFHRYGGYLPDHLVSRNLRIDGNSIPESLAADMPSQIAEIVVERDALTDAPIVESGYIENVSMAQLAQLRSRGVTRYTLEPTLRTSAVIGESDLQDQRAENLKFARRCESFLAARVSSMQRNHPQTEIWLSVLTAQEYLEVDHRLEDIDSLVSARKLLIAGQGGQALHALIYATNSLGPRPSSTQLKSTSSTTPAFSVDQRSTFAIALEDFNNSLADVSSQMNG